MMAGLGFAALATSNDRRDLLAHLLRTGLVNRAVVFRLFGIPKKTGSHATRRWRRQSAANPSLKWDFRNNARSRGVYSTVTAA